MLPFCAVSDNAVKKEVFYFGKFKASIYELIQVGTNLFGVFF